MINTMIMAAGALPCAMNGRKALKSSTKTWVLGHLQVILSKELIMIKAIAKKIASGRRVLIKITIPDGTSSTPTTELTKRWLHGVVNLA